MTQLFDKVLFLDAETRWSRKATEWCPDTYTLSNLTTEEYIRSPLFKAFGFGYKWLTDGHKWRPGDPVLYDTIEWVSYDQLPELFRSIDWSRTAICCHNAQFDAAIVAWIYGIKPAFIFDTLSMARATRGLEVGNSAAKLALDFDLPEKGKEVFLTDGLYELTPEIEEKLAGYCKHDVWLCEQFFLRLVENYPTKELKLIDTTIRMFTEPQLELDTGLLERAISEEQNARASLLASLGVDEQLLASNDKFAEVLRAVGVEPPTKISKTTGKEAYAFAKNDALFQALQNSDDERVVQLCEARMKVKSTQERTRAQRFLDIASRGKLPVPVNYAHTRTLRWGACLVAETKILVYDRLTGPCEKRIVDVLPDDLVWDGVEYVQHAGVQFSGYQEVISHDGITGTSEHEVFISETESCRLDEAASRGARIMDSPAPDERAMESARALFKRNGW